VNERRLAEARVQVAMAAEKLELLQSGRISSEVATVIRAPITGFVLDKNVEIGDPVVPLTSFQEGTVLMTMADMSDLIFRGTVDEIDVGRLVEGMPVEIRIGALPRTRVEGELQKIWLKARKAGQLHGLSDRDCAYRCSGDR
jgi:HlyD family secretion protein